MLVVTEDHSGGIIPFRGQVAACDANGILADFDFDLRHGSNQMCSSMQADRPGSVANRGDLGFRLREPPHFLQGQRISIGALLDNLGEQVYS